MESEVRRPIAKGVRRCAFTGYRPMKMPFGYDEECPLALDFKRRLYDTIEMLILQGYWSLQGDAGFVLLQAFSFAKNYRAFMVRLRTVRTVR